MFLGRVVGQVWATRKMADLEGKRLLVVEPLEDPTGEDAGKTFVTPVVVADPIGADLGERVICAFGKAARVACGGDGDYAFEAAIVGIVDGVQAPGGPESWQLDERITPGSGSAASASKGGQR